MSVLPPGLIATAGAAQGVPTPAVAVSSSSSGILGPPIGWAGGWVIVSNASPWLMSVTTAEGGKTILPFTADLCLPVAVGVAYQMAPPPGPPILVSNPWIQADWYIAGGGRPSGTFPYPLTSQAIQASAQQAQLIFSQVLTIGTGTTLETISFPPCLALLAQLYMSGVTGPDLQVTTETPAGLVLNNLWRQTSTEPSGDIGYWQVFPPPGGQITYALNTLSGTLTVHLNVFALQSPVQDLVAPAVFGTTVSAGANSVTTGSSAALHSWNGTLQGDAATGLGGSPPPGDWYVILQSFEGGSSWTTIGSVGGSATGPADTRVVRCPPGTGRLIYGNMAAAAVSIGGTFTQ